MTTNLETQKDLGVDLKNLTQARLESVVNPDDVRFSAPTDKSEWWETWWKKWREKLEQTKERDRDYWNGLRELVAKINEEMPEKRIDDATIEENLENTRKELLLNALKEGNPDKLEELLFSWLPEETPEQVQSIINWLESYLENQVKVKLAEAKNDPKLNYRIAVIEEEKHVKEMISAYERIKVKMEA